MKHTLILEDLNCAHCAAKIETKISETEGYENVSFNFATKKLNFESEKENPVAEIQQICDSIEDGVTVKNASEHAHIHTDEHNHEHSHEHSNEKKKPSLKNILLAAAVVLAVAALIFHLTLGDGARWLVFALSLASTLSAGYDVFLKGFKNAIKLNIEETVLITIAVIAAFILGEFVEAAMVTVLFCIGEFIEDLAVGKSRRDIEKLSQIRPDTATLYHDGHEHKVPAAEVSVGSIILVKPHERVPLDGVVLEGASTLDNSALTGESIPVNVSAGSEALSGAINGDGLIKLKTTKEFGDSTATRILRLVEDAAAQKGKSEKFITRFANIYTPVVIVLAVLIAVLPPVLGFGSFQQWIYNALAVLVASCPCAIVISVPLAYYAGIGAGSRLGVLIKGGKYLEALAKADAIAFDKTGTLTTGKIAVGEVFAYGGYNQKEVLDLAAACEKYSSHPIAKAIVSKANSTIELENHNEIAGQGTSASYKGKSIVCGNDRLLKGKAPAELFGKNVIYVIYGGELIGAIELVDSLRSEAKDILSQLDALGVHEKVMLTGDSAANAQAAAKELGGIKTHAELMPQDKLKIIGRMKRHGKTVLFVGDGINDAPVLSASDCGIAMGLGSEAAIEAADAVLSSGDLTALPKAVRLGRKVMNTIRTNIVFALAVKLLVIILAFFSAAPMWLSVLADTGVSVVCVLYTARLLSIRN